MSASSSQVIIASTATVAATRPYEPRMSNRPQPSQPIAAEFSPRWWLRNGHLQTLLGLYFPRPPHIESPASHIVQLPDGDRLQLFENRPPADQTHNSEHAVLLIHGLGGSHRSPYLQRLTEQLVQRGRRVLRIDLRGSGDGHHLAARPAHAGCSHDVAAGLLWASEHLGVQRWQVVGFSMGGNIALKLAGELSRGLWPELSGEVQIERVMAVCPPINLSHCSDQLARGAGRLYSNYFLRALRQAVIERAKHWPQWRSLPLDPWPKTIRQFDDRFTAPMAGFDDAEHYYQSSSSKPLLGEIRLPTDILFDQHDPVIPSDMFRHVQPHSHLRLYHSRFGGHLGYVDQTSGQPARSWMVDWLVHQLSPASHC
jgi:uncharacterized protein